MYIHIICDHHAVVYANSCASQYMSIVHLMILYNNCRIHKMKGYNKNKCSLNLQDLVALWPLRSAFLGWLLQSR